MTELHLCHGRQEAGSCRGSVHRYRSVAVRRCRYGQRKVLWYEGPRTEDTFAAPVLIVHYIEEHGYLPPAEFLKAVEEA
jgi:hypothetical protein